MERPRRDNAQRSTAWGIAVLASVVWLGGTAASAEEKAEPVVVTKTQDGLKFTVPPDWPIEKRGGVVAPIPIEEYLGQKFKAIDSRLQALEQRFNGLDVRLRVLEEAAKQQQRQGLRSLEEPAP